jgi:hypothetical protein
VVTKRNGIAIPIPLPSKEEEGSYPSIVTDYTIDDIMGLEQFLLTQWTGGGFYKVEVTDSKGDALSWEFGFPTSLYPERVPPPMMDSAVASAPAAQATTAAQATGRAFGTSSSFLNRQTPGVPMSAVPPPLGHLAQFPTLTADDRVRQLEHQLNEERRTRLETEMARKLEAERQKYETELTKYRDQPRHDEMARLREEREREYREATQRQLAALADLVAKATAPREDTVMVERLRQLEEDRKRDRETYERERAEERHRQELRDIQARQDAQMAELKLQLASNKQSDPMVEFMREQQRESRAQFDRMTQYMITPQQITQLVKETSNGSDDAMRKMVQGFSAAFDVQAKTMQHMAELTSGGSVIPEMIKDGIAQVADGVNNWTAAQRDIGVSQAQAQRAQAEAARAAVAAQNAPTQPMNGAPAPLPVELQNAVPAAPTNGQTAPAQPVPAPQPQVVITDEQMFGPAFPAIVKLRAKVVGPWTDEATGITHPQITADMAATQILEGIGYAQKHNAVDQIPAFQLLEEDRDEDLIYVIFPKMADFFREACLKEFRDQVSSVDEVEDGDEDEEDDDGAPPEITAAQTAEKRV